MTRQIALSSFKRLVNSLCLGNKSFSSLVNIFLLWTTCPVYALLKTWISSKIKMASGQQSCSFSKLQDFQRNVTLHAHIKNEPVVKKKYSYPVSKPFGMKGRKEK